MKTQQIIQPGFEADKFSYALVVESLTITPNLIYKLNSINMEITITWTKIIVVTITYFTGRYLFYAYLKWHTGCPEPLNPTEFYETSVYTRGWNMGYIHGSHRLKIKYDKCRRQLAETKEKHRIAHAKASALEASVRD